MFIPVGERPSPDLRPRSSEVSAGDWDILSHYWYPVAVARVLTDQPFRAQILHVPIVLFRGGDAAIAAVLDICPHRHVRLSTGRIVDGEIECPFHGLRFGADGRCRYVPALGRRSNLPDSYRVRSFPTVERYGLIWTCIGDATRHEVPAFWSLHDVDPEELAIIGPQSWPISPPRQVENFSDLAHLPFIHGETLGGDPGRAVKPARIELTNDGLIGRAIFDEGKPGMPSKPIELTYRIVLPFMVEFTSCNADEPDHLIESCDIAVPAGAYRSNVFQIVKSPGGREQAEAVLDFLQQPNAEDITMLDALMMPDLPLEQFHEIHLPVDNIASSYRRRLRDIGLGQQAA